MKNLILLITVLFWMANCVSKAPSPFVLPNPEEGLVPELSPPEKREREPSGFFDRLFNKRDPALTLMKCDNCNTPFADPGTIQLEAENTCAKDRLYYQDEFKRVSELFRLKRETFPEAKFPAACVVYIMRSFGAYEAPSKYVAHCPSEDVEPVRGRKMVCVTPEYAYSTYNSYVDVMDCLGIPQKELIPKLWNESHFHVNTYGGGEDAGVGQLTGDAIRDVIKQKFVDKSITELEFYRREVSQSEKPSCKRIMAEESAWKAVSAEVSGRCGIMRPASSPLRNLLYTGIFYRSLAERLAGLHYRDGKEYVRTEQGLVERTTEVPLGGAIGRMQFKEKLQALGIENPNMDYVKGVLITLSFNAGTRTAISLFDNFLKARLAANMTLSEQELDFLTADSSKEIALVNAADNETAEAKQAREALLAAARETSFQRGLPQYLRLMQIRGAPGYVSKVAFRTRKLNQEVGESLCTEPSFLRHSSPPAQVSQ
jgi:hypothetical protein